MSRPDAGPPALAGAMSACAAGLLAALLCALALYFAQASGSLQQAALAAGVVLAAALVAAAALLWRRRLDAFRLASLPALALIAAAAAAYGGAALPADVHLRTIGRPPEFVWPLASCLALAVVLQLVLVARGEGPARAGLLVLLPALTLEGLPLGAPPAFAAAAGGILLLLSSPGAPRTRVPLLLPIGLFLACSALSTALAADPTPGVAVVLRLAALSCAFVLIAGDPQPERAARLGLAALLATLLVVALAALSVHFRLKSTLAEFGADAMVTELSLFGRHPNVLAPWFGAGAVLCLHLAFTRASRLRLLALLAILPATACLFLTASRLAIAASLAGVFLPVFFGLRRARWVMLAAVGATAVLCAALVLSPALRDKTLNKARHANVLGESHRLHRMETALATAEERPWLGQGPLCWFRQGAFASHSRFDGENTADHPHCLPLALLESTGILGSAAFFALLLAAALLLRQNLRDSDV
ncbi:MAG: O-antigen ligase family protein [Planctomycetes bacterium]|nr:O-antigen ligase family protein [Planctomycetota bacterium]